MIREQMVQVDSRLQRATDNLVKLRAQRAAVEKARRAEPTMADGLRVDPLHDFGPDIAEAEKQVATLTSEHGRLAKAIEASEATPEVRAARAKHEAAEKAVRAADAVAVAALRDGVLPAMDRLGEAHAKVAAATAEVRRTAVALASARGEPPDYTYSVARTTFGDLAVPDDAAATAEVVRFLLSRESFSPARAGLPREVSRE